MSSFTHYSLITAGQVANACRADHDFMNALLDEITCVQRTKLAFGVAEFHDDPATICEWLRAFAAEIEELRNDT